MITGMPPALLAIVLVTGLLALVPTRRVHLAGWSQAAVGAYFLALWIGAAVIAWAPGTARFLVPIVLVAYLAPFVTLRAGVDRLLGRPRPPAPRNVTPRDPGDDVGTR
jgi:hypothetical protein